jgi:alpha-mannosidase
MRFFVTLQAAQLPQVLLQCGLKFFVGSLESNSSNSSSSSTYIWQGLDNASSVLTHFPPAGTLFSQVVFSMSFNYR